MPARKLVARELASLLSVLSHPDRIRIVEELRAGEKDVKSLVAALELRQSRVSQHLAQLRNHHLVVERREGRHHYYHLARKDLAAWLLEGLDFIEAELMRNTAILQAAQEAREAWGEEPKETAKAG